MKGKNNKSKPLRFELIDIRVDTSFEMDWLEFEVKAWYRESWGSEYYTTLSLSSSLRYSGSDFHMRSSGRADEIARDLRLLTALRALFDKAKAETMVGRIRAIAPIIPDKETTARIRMVEQSRLAERIELKYKLEQTAAFLNCSIVEKPIEASV